MLNITNIILSLFTDKTKLQKALNNPYLTNKNTKDFNNSNYDLSRLDIAKYIIVLEYLHSIKNDKLATYLNPYLDKIYKSSNKFPFYVYNGKLEVNQYKNVIIDLFFSTIPELAFSTIPLNILWGQVKNKTEISFYGQELKELKELGYGFEYFGSQKTLNLLPEFIKSFYNNITLYYNEDDNSYLFLNDILTKDTKDKKEYIKLYWKITDILACPPNLYDNSELITTEWVNNSILDTDSTNMFNVDNKFLQDYQLICNIDNSNQDQDFIDTNTEIQLYDILKSELNSKFIELILDIK